VWRRHDDAEAINGERPRRRRQIVPLLLASRVRSPFFLNKKLLDRLVMLNSLHPRACLCTMPCKEAKATRRQRERCKRGGRYLLRVVYPEPLEMSLFWATEILGPTVHSPLFYLVGRCSPANYRSIYIN
jgi:hypothetical protein